MMMSYDPEFDDLLEAEFVTDFVNKKEEEEETILEEETSDDDDDDDDWDDDDDNDEEGDFDNLLNLDQSNDWQTEY
jgi:hypothetical protein